MVHGGAMRSHAAQLPSLLKFFWLSVAASWGEVRLAALLLFAIRCLLRTGEAVGLRWIQLSLGSRSGVVALQWTKRVQGIVTIDDPVVNGLLLYLRNGVGPMVLVYPGGAVGLREWTCKRKFIWIRWCTPGYSNSEAFSQIVLLSLLPSLYTQKRYHQAGERGKTHVFDVLPVSLVCGSAVTAL